MRPTGSPFESVRSSAHASADGASFIGHENMSPQPVVKLSGSWKKMAYRVTRSLPHRTQTHKFCEKKRKKLLGARGVNRCCSFAENCGKFVHLAPIPECPYFPDVKSRKKSGIHCMKVIIYVLSSGGTSQPKRISIAISKTIILMLFFHG